MKNHPTFFNLLTIRMKICYGIKRTSRLSSGIVHTHIFIQMYFVRTRFFVLFRNQFKFLVENPGPANQNQRKLLLARLLSYVRLEKRNWKAEFSSSILCWKLMEMPKQVQLRVPTVTNNVKMYLCSHE